MGYRKYRDAQRRDYPAYADTDIEVADAADDQLVSAATLSRLSGASEATVRRFAATGMLPVASVENGKPLFDLADDRIAEWVSALRGVGYHLSSER